MYSFLAKHWRSWHSLNPARTPVCSALLCRSVYLFLDHVLTPRLCHDITAPSYPPCNPSISRLYSTNPCITYALDADNYALCDLESSSPPLTNNIKSD